MKALYKDYLEIIRSFINETAPVLTGESTPEEIFELASIHATQGIVSYIFMHYPELSDENTHEFMRQFCLNTVVLYTRRAELMKRLMEKLDEAGIDHLMMKGFIVREYYTVPELRTFGDIDFNIKAEDREKCDELMRSLGYEVTTDWEPVYTYRKEAELYEVHTDIMTVKVTDKSDSIEYFSHMWDYIEPYTNKNYGHTYVFRPEYHFVYTLAHIAKHVCGSGAGIRMYLDVAFFIKHFGESFNWDWIMAELKKLALDDFVNTVFTAMETWFGLKSPVKLNPIPENVQVEFLEYTMEGGVFGYNGRDKSLVFLKQQNRNGQKVSKFRTLLWHAFPPISELDNKYTYLKKHRWLLPFAWLHRLFDSRKEWRRFADHTKKIISADENEVLKLKKIYKDIGL